MRQAPSERDEVVTKMATRSPRGRRGGRDHARRGGMVRIIEPSLRHPGPAGSPVGPITRR